MKCRRSSLAPTNGRAQAWPSPLFLPGDGALVAPDRERAEDEDDDNSPNHSSPDVVSAATDRQLQPLVHEQIGMMLGFVTSWPVNRWLIRRGIKEPMATI